MLDQMQCEFTQGVKNFYKTSLKEKKAKKIYRDWPKVVKIMTSYKVKTNLIFCKFL